MCTDTKAFVYNRLHLSKQNITSPENNASHTDVIIRA